MMVVTDGLISLIRRKAAYILSSTAHSGPLCTGPFDAQLVYHFSMVTCDPQALSAAARCTATSASGGPAYHAEFGQGMQLRVGELATPRRAVIGDRQRVPGPAWRRAAARPELRIACSWQEHGEQERAQHATQCCRRRTPLEITGALVRLPGTQLAPAWLICSRRLLCRLRVLVLVGTAGTRLISPSILLARR